MANGTGRINRWIPFLALAYAATCSKDDEVLHGGTQQDAGAAAGGSSGAFGFAGSLMVPPEGADGGVFCAAGLQTFDLTPATSDGGQMRECVFPLVQALPVDVEVAVDAEGHRLAQDDPDGWRFAMGGLQIELLGTACEAFMAGIYNHVVLRVVRRCPTAGP